MAGGGFLADGQRAGGRRPRPRSPNRPPTEEAAAQTADEDLLDADALDDLVAPIALYPDALLTQVLVAATFPLDVVKADRFLDESKDLPEKERADKAAQRGLGSEHRDARRRLPERDRRGWPTRSTGPSSSATRCSRSPTTCSTRCSGMRSRAVAAGTLTSNEAQVVDTEGDNISIEPADPNVVYVPSYDATTAYTAPPAGTVATAPVYPVDSGWSTGEIITTGAIAFGGALLLDEIFDDDDD